MNDKKISRKKSSTTKDIKKYNKMGRRSRGKA